VLRGCCDGQGIKTMSTIMYCFYVKKSNLWQFVSEMRKFYETNGVASKLDRPFSIKALEFLDNHKSEFEAKLQLFDRRNYWLFRVLENNYMFLNSWKNISKLITPVFYDTRSVGYNSKRGKAMAEFVYSEIENKRYFIVPVFGIEDILFNA
jgi:hypothetical protein